MGMPPPSTASRAQVAAMAARLSAAIYAPDRAGFARAAGAAGCHVSHFFDHAETQAALCLSEQHAFLVFRGTEATRLRLVDIAANLKLIPTPWAGAGWVHAGYDDALARVRFQARRFAETVAAHLPLYLTGHSLGGALATLYAAWVSADPLEGHSLAGLITFGAPKTGSRRALAPLCRKIPSIERFVMPFDFAPRWPPLVHAHPVAASTLEPLSPWPGPISRHSVTGYVDATARHAARLRAIECDRAD